MAKKKKEDVSVVEDIMDLEATLAPDDMTGDATITAVAENGTKSAAEEEKGLSDAEKELMEAAVKAAETGLSWPVDEVTVVGIESAADAVDEDGFDDDAPATRAAPSKAARKPKERGKSMIAPDSEEKTAAYGMTDDVLTITRGDVVDDESAEADFVWHTIQHAYRARRILTGTISGTRRSETGHIHTLVNFHGVAITIPDTEMGIYVPEEPRNRFMDPQVRLAMLINRMLGAEIDFIVRGYDNESRAVVASRKAAMDIKVSAFYRPLSENTLPLIYPGRRVQARVVAVSEKAIRIEVFGVERTLYARYLSWEWITDARELYQVGDEVIVKVRRVSVDPDTNEVYLDASTREATDNTMMDKLEHLSLQDHYSGTITDIHKGVNFIHLDCGLNAVAHDCRDFRRPSRKDVVSFVALHKDFDQGVVLGVITRIIRHGV